MAAVLTAYAIAAGYGWINFITDIGSRGCMYMTGGARVVVNTGSALYQFASTPNGQSRLPNYLSVQAINQSTGYNYGPSFVYNDQIACVASGGSGAGMYLVEGATGLQSIAYPNGYRQLTAAGVPAAQKLGAFASVTLGKILAPLYGVLNPNDPTSNDWFTELLPNQGTSAVYLDDTRAGCVSCALSTDLARFYGFYSNEVSQTFTALSHMTIVTYDAVTKAALNTFDLPTGLLITTAVTCKGGSLNGKLILKAGTYPGSGPTANKELYEFDPTNNALNALTSGLKGGDAMSVPPGGAEVFVSSALDIWRLFPPAGSTFDGGGGGGGDFDNGGEGGGTGHECYSRRSVCMGTSYGRRQAAVSGYARRGTPLTMYARRNGHCECVHEGPEA